MLDKLGLVDASLKGGGNQAAMLLGINGRLIVIWRVEGWIRLAEVLSIDHDGFYSVRINDEACKRALHEHGQATTQQG